MKKLLYIFAAAAALSAVSCVKEEFNESQDGATTFYGKALDVKTAVIDGHTVWTATDNIKVFYNGTSVEAELKTGENTSSATFEAAVGTATDYYAVYPASETASMTDGVMKVTLPATQDGSFGAGHVAVAKAADKIFTFVNVNAFLKMTLAKAKYTRVVVESVGGQALAGDLSISFADGTPVVAETFQNTVSSVEVTSEAAFAAGDLYISVLPGVTHTQGILVTCYNGEEKVGAYLVDKPVLTEASVTLTFDVFEPDGNYYVTAEGAGNNNGLSLANAMSVEKMVALLKKSTEDSAAKIAVDGAVFHLASGEYELAEEALDLVYSGAEPVKLAFKADGEVAFTGNEVHSIMAITGADVTLEGIIIKNSVATEQNTGAIKVSGENSKLTLSKCTLIDNTVNGTKIVCGGVAVTEGAELVVTECEAINNDAYSASVFYVDGAEMTVTETLFEGNWTSDDAGVMFLAGDQKSTFTNCDFTSNAAYKHGIIKHDSGNTTFTNCTFKKNKVYKEADGGVFTLLEGSEGELVVNGGEISENYAGWGSGIYHEKGGATVTLSNILFKNNECAGSGAIWSGGNSSITKCTFDANTGAGTAKTDGQSLTVATGANMYLYGCTIMNHTTSSSSTAAVVRDGAVLHISKAADGTRSVIKDNTAAWGGAVSISAGGVAYVSDTDVLDNHAKGAGAFRVVEKASLSLTDCVLKGNYTTNGNGGAVAFESTGTFTSNRCHYEGNYAQNEGGAIKVDKSGSTIYLNACTFKGNYNQKQPAGTTIQVHCNGAFAMNNCTIADDTYAQANHASEPRISWMSFNEPEKVWLSNNTLIGVPRENGNPTHGGLVRIWFDVDTDAYFVNNIVVNDSQENTWAFCQYDKTMSQSNVPSVTLYHTKYSVFENVSACESRITYKENPTSTGFSTDSFAGLTWNASQCYWSWNGTMTSGGNTNKITKDQFVSTLNDAQPEFMAWLEEINALDKDQLGNSRGNGEWWPGSYQKN